MNNKILIVLIFIVGLCSVMNMIDKITDALIKEQNITIQKPKVDSIKDI